MAKSTKKVNEGRLAGFEDPIRGLATEVVNVLNARVQKNNPTLRPNVLRQLVHFVIGLTPKDPDELVLEMRMLRLSDDDLVNLYIPEAARHLGTKWEQDELNFAQVTIGCARLQSVLHHLSDSWVDGTHIEPADRSQTEIAFVLATFKGDEHSLGSVALATKLRRQGHVVHLLLGATQAEIAETVARQTPDCVMFSCSGAAVLEHVAKLCEKTRMTMALPPIIAVGGLVLDHEESVEERTGADLATRDIQTVLHLCQSRRAGQISVVPR